MPITIPSVKVSLILKCPKWPWTDKEISLDNGPDTLEILTAVFSDHVHVIAYEFIAIINASTINCVCHVHFFIGILYAIFFFCKEPNLHWNIFASNWITRKRKTFFDRRPKRFTFQKGVKYWFFSAVEPTPEFDNHPLTFLIDLLFVFHLYRYLKLDFVSQNRVQRTKPHRYFIF